jgi:hypothetical protein
VWWPPCFMWMLFASQWKTCSLHIVCGMRFLSFCFGIVGSEVPFLLRFCFGRCKLHACKQLHSSAFASTAFPLSSVAETPCLFFGIFLPLELTAPLLVSRSRFRFSSVFSSLRRSLSVSSLVSCFSRAAASDPVVFSTREFKARRQDSVFSCSSRQGPSWFVFQPPPVFCVSVPRAARSSPMETPEPVHWGPATRSFAPAVLPCSVVVECCSRLVFNSAARKLA